MQKLKNFHLLRFWLSLTWTRKYAESCVFSLNWEKVLLFIISFFSPATIQPKKSCDSFEGDCFDLTSTTTTSQFAFFIP